MTSTDLVRAAAEEIAVKYESVSTWTEIAAIISRHLEGEQHMIVRDDAERFIRQHLSSAQWEGESLMITFEQEALIAALIRDLEPESDLYRAGVAACVEKVKALQKTTVSPLVRAALVFMVDDLESITDSAPYLCQECGAVTEDVEGPGEGERGVRCPECGWEPVPAVTAVGPVPAQPIEKGDTITFRDVGDVLKTGIVEDFAPRVFGGLGCSIKTSVGWTDSESVTSAVKAAPAQEHRCPHFMPKGEDSSGAYNAKIIADVTNDLLDPIERDRLNAKPTAWYSLLIKQLIQRIANLRVMLSS